MSDTSGGEGWWLASDGKWYPPESRPAPPAPPPPPVATLPTPYGVAPHPELPWKPGDPLRPVPGNPRTNRRAWPWVLGVIGAVIVVFIIVLGATSNSTKTNPNATPGLHQVAKDGSFAFVVKSFTCGATTIGTIPQVATAAAGTTWCMATISVTNDKDGSNTFYASVQAALTAAGQTLKPNTTALNAMINGQESSQSTVASGTTIVVTLPFQVETTTHVRFLDLHDGFFSGGVTVQVAS